MTSLAIANSGLLNNENICIKDMNTSFMCVCKKCIEEQIEALENFDFNEIQFRKEKFSFKRFFNELIMSVEIAFLAIFGR